MTLPQLLESHTAVLQRWFTATKKTLESQLRKSKTVDGMHLITRFMKVVPKVAEQSAAASNVQYSSLPLEDQSSDSSTEGGEEY